MTPAETFEQVGLLNAEASQAERDRIRNQYGEMPEEEMKLRLAAPRLGRETMVKVFGWDPEVWGW